MLVSFFEITGLISGKSLQSRADLVSAKSPEMGINLDKPKAGAEALNKALQAQRGDKK